jgi:hypothetical protein
MRAAPATRPVAKRAIHVPALGDAALAAPAPVQHTSRIPALSARLARLAVDVDELAQQVIAEPLNDCDELFLAAPTAHLALVLAWLEQALYETDRLDLSQSGTASPHSGRHGPEHHAHGESHGDPSPAVPRQPRGARAHPLEAVAR